MKNDNYEKKVLYSKDLYSFIFFKRKSYFFIRRYYDKNQKCYDIKQGSLIFSKEINKVPNGVP